jgi:hypothetical protein
MTEKIRPFGRRLAAFCAHTKETTFRYCVKGYVKTPLKRECEECLEGLDLVDKVRLHQ